MITAADISHEPLAQGILGIIVWTGLAVAGLKLADAFERPEGCPRFWRLVATAASHVSRFADRNAQQGEWPDVFVKG
jgi:hypothetical protein